MPTEAVQSTAVGYVLTQAIGEIIQRAITFVHQFILILQENRTMPDKSSYPALIILIVIGFTSCASKQYSFKNYHSSQSEVVVTGKVVDAKSKLAIPGVLIRNDINSSRVYTNKDGLYKMNLNSKSSMVSAVCIGYYNNVAKKLKLNNGDSIVVNFRMKEDSRPLP